LSRQIESRRDRVKVDEFSVATESVVAIQMDVSPSRRDFRNYGQGFRILVCLVPGPTWPEAKIDVASRKVAVIR
jgi:hypothetical protein